MKTLIGLNKKDKKIYNNRNLNFIVSLDKK